MSHFKTLIIGENPEEQLAPFDEGLEVPEYLVSEGELKDSWIVKEFIKQGRLKPEFKGEELLSIIHAEWSDGADYSLQGEELFRKTTRNPKSKWDWYLLGGRWTGSLILKLDRAGVVGKPGLNTLPASGGRADQALKGDVDFKVMDRDVLNTAEELYDSFIYKGRPEDRGLAYFQFGISAVKVEVSQEYPDGWRVPTKEEWLERQDGLLLHAILHEGEWLEIGEMHMFGVVTEKIEEREWIEKCRSLIQNLDDGALLSVYDLHI